MSRSHSRRQLASYRRRRRSPIPVLIFLAALVMLAVVLFQVFRSRGEAESLPSLLLFHLQFHRHQRLLTFPLPFRWKRPPGT